MPSIVKVPRYDVYDDYDFIGFSFNGLHCIEDLHIVRVSESSRYKENLTPQIQEVTNEHPGMDGAFLTGVQHRQRVFDIPFAFDGLTQQQVWNIQEAFLGEGIHDLWFDEYPFKVWDAKVTGQPQLQVIPFDDGNGGILYKGEGTVQFTAYYPYAHTPDYVYKDGINQGDGRLLSSYDGFSNVDQWSESANLMQSPYNKNYFFVGGEAPTSIELNCAYSNFILEGTNTFTIKGIRNEVEHLIVPNKFQNIPIKYIAENAFQNNTFKKAEVEGWIQIRDQAFYWCPNLQEILFKDVVSHFEDDKIFRIGQQIKKIQLPLLQHIQQIGGLYGYDFMENNEDAKEKYYMSHLTEFYLTNKNKNIRPLEVPEKYFAFCPHLSTVEIDEGFTKLGKYAFLNCSLLTKIKLPSQLICIEEGAFSHCTHLSEIRLPNTITSIPDYAFYKDTNLQSINLNKVESVGKYAFFNTNIKRPNLSFNNYGYEIGNYAFANDVEIDKRNEFSSLHFAGTIIGEHAFEKSKIKNIIAFDSNIGTQAFRQVIGLEECELQNDTGVGDKAFEQSSVKKIILKDLTYLGDYAFSQCENLVSIDFDGFRLSNLPQGVFFKCSSLTTINLPDSITTLQKGAFDKCSKLKTVNQKNVTEVGEEAFNTCQSLQNFDFSKIISIGKKAFANTGIKELKSNTIQTIGEQGFALCYSLTTVELTNTSLTEIPNSTFNKCSSLTTITLPETVTEIGPYAIPNDAGDVTLTVGSFPSNDTWTFIPTNSAEERRSYSLTGQEDTYLGYLISRWRGGTWYKNLEE